MRGSIRAPLSSHLTSKRAGNFIRQQLMHFLASSFIILTSHIVTRSSLRETYVVRASPILRKFKMRLYCLFYLPKVRNESMERLFWHVVSRATRGLYSWKHKRQYPPKLKRVKQTVAHTKGLLLNMKRKERERERATYTFLWRRESSRLKSILKRVNRTVAHTKGLLLLNIKGKSLYYCGK